MSDEQMNTTKMVKKQEGQMGAWARYYDFLMFFMTRGRERRFRQDTIEMAQIRQGDSVLEVGSGTGSLTIAAKAQVGSSGEVAGIDIAPEMVRVARRKAARKGRDISFQEGSIERIPFPDDHFDVVMCSFMIFHMPEDVRRRGFSEIYRVLKNGGHLFILDVALPDKPRKARNDELPMHDVRELAPVLKEHSFTEIEMEETKYAIMGRQLWSIRGRAEKGKNRLSSVYNGP